MSKRKWEFPSVSYSCKGDFEDLTSWLEKIQYKLDERTLKKFGEKGVEALKEVTPRRTGKTAESWYYEIDHAKDGITVTWKNSNLSHHVSVALLIQYGHVSKRGVWISGIDYINPTIQPIMDEMLDKIWREVTDT